MIVFLIILLLGQMQGLTPGCFGRCGDTFVLAAMFVEVVAEFIFIFHDELREAFSKPKNK